jgi:succinyl-diaminopimelate desuccinylase
MTATLELAEQLIARPSLTPDDAGCQELIARRLAAMGFACESVVSGPADFRVTNLWAKRPAHAAASAAVVPVKTLVFAGHTDVVPTGPLDQWTSPPFAPSYRDGRLYGRGASDMKTSLAAFVVAVEEFLQRTPQPNLNLAFLLTSDEEGPALDGTVVVCEMMKARGEPLDYCIVGEPGATQRSGDMIKNGRRGSLSARLLVKGLQGHIAYPQQAKNPVHLLAPALTELVSMKWDEGNDFFQPTSWQVSNIHAGTGAGNVIPGTATVDFNFRFSTESSPQSLQGRLLAVLDQHGLDYDIAWTLGGLPFLTTPGTLVDVVRQAILAETAIETRLSTSGGTSDGRFIARICPQVVELGPPNASIHQIDEYVEVAEVEPLKNIYRRIIEALDRQAAA